MRIPFLAATASVLLLAGAAAAQPASSPPDANGAAASPAPAAAPPEATPAPSADTSAASVPTSGYNFTPGTPPAVADLAQAKAGDPGILSNAPIPDTHANRSAFGKPNSAAGRRTKPRGN